MTSILRAAEKKYYSDKLEVYRNDTKKTWKVLNNMIARKNKLVIKEFVCETGVTSNGKEIENAFNNYFINIGPSLANKIDHLAVSILSWST